MERARGMLMRWQVWKQRVTTALYRLFQGRYGGDQLTVVLLIASMLCFLAARFTRLPWLMLLYYVGMFWGIWRMFSRNFAARSRENQRMLSLVHKGRAQGRMLRNRFRDRKDFRYLKCPACGQHLRVPKGKGKIEVTCRSCRAAFIRKV